MARYKISFQPETIEADTAEQAAELALRLVQLTGPSLAAIEQLPITCVFCNGVLDHDADCTRETEKLDKGTSNCDYPEAHQEHMAINGECPWCGSYDKSKWLKT